MIGIYKITSPSNRVYIGQSLDIDRRWSSYKKGKVHCGKLKNSFKKHNVENHIFEVLEECEIESLNERERYWQDFYESTGSRGLNILLTTTLTKSGIIPEDVRQKIRLSITGKNVGKIRTKEQNRKNSELRLGIKQSKESNSKRSRTMKGRKVSGGISRRVIDTISLKTFDTVKDAAESINMRPDYLRALLIGMYKNKTNFIYYEDYLIK